MKCYQHRESEAVGVCSACFKAICQACARDAGGKLVCSECLRKTRVSVLEAPVSVGWARAGAARKAGMLPALKGLAKLIFPGKRNMPVMREKRAEMITPVFLGGVVAGILAGLPFLNLLFIPIVMLGAALAVVFLRAEEEFEFAVGEEQGKRAGALAGAIAALVSILVVISVEMLFAASAFEAAKAALAFSPSTIDFLLKLAGLDKDLSLSLIQLRFVLSIIAFPAIGYFGGLLAARKMR